MLTLSHTHQRVAQLIDDQEAEAPLLLRCDFDDCGPDAEVTAALEELVATGRLAQLREDAYAYIEYSERFQKVILRRTLQDLGRQYALRHGAEIRLSSAQAEYNAGSHQVPNGRWIGVDRAIEGRLQFRGRTVEYECV